MAEGRRKREQEVLINRFEERHARTKDSYGRFLERYERFERDFAAKPVGDQKSMPQGGEPAPSARDH